MAPSPARAQRRRTVRWVLSATLLVLVGWAAWSALELRTVRQASLAAAESADATAQAGRDRDSTAARLHADRLAEHTSTAAAAARSVPLRLAARLPLLGGDLRAVQTVTDVTSRIAEQTVRPLVDAAQPLLDGDGLDPQTLRTLAPTAQAAHEVARDAHQEVTGIDSSALHEPVRSQVGVAAAQIARLEELTADAADATRLVPPMLGADEPRTYLLAFQNLAEARPTGGIIGSWAEVQVRDGDLRLLDSGSNNDLGHLDAGGFEVDDEARALWGADLARSQNFNLTPHFPRAAELLSQLWQTTGRQAPDGVVSIDPVVLQQVLADTGPLDVAGGPTLTGENTAEWLMNGVYEVHGGGTDERDTYLQRVTAGVFERLADEDGARVFAELLQNSSIRRHVMVWSAEPGEQQFLERMGVAGALPEPTADKIGVFVTNVDASKLDHYLRRDLTVEQDCDASGAGARLTLRNRAPRKVHPYVGSHLGDGSPQGATTHRVIVSWYLAPGRGVRSLERDGDTQAFAVGRDRGWTVVSATVDVPHGAQVTLDLDLQGDRTPIADVLTQPAESSMKQSVTRCPRTGS